MDILKKWINPKGEEQMQSIPVEQICTNPNQPRKIFKEEEIDSLALSIEELGILQPLTVRKLETGWELVAGERRLRASKQVGLKYVPCLVMDVSEETSSILSLVENIQREDLDYFEEAAAIANLIALYGLSQEAVAKKLGKSQSAVANSLRLLKLSEPVIELLRESGCTQRHARALLKLPEEEERLEVLGKVIAQSLNVAQTESLIEAYLEPKEEKGKGSTKIILRDVRLFLNTISKSLNLMQAAGVDARCEKEEKEKEICVTIHIPKE